MRHRGRAVGALVVPRPFAEYRTGREPPSIGRRLWAEPVEGEKVDVRVQRRLAAMHDAVDGFLEVVATLGDDEWDRATGCPGWTVRDVVAHVVGLEDVLTGGVEPDVEVPDLPHVANDVSRYTERHVAFRRAHTPQQLLDELGTVVARRRDQLAGDLEVMAPSFLGGEQPLSRSLGLRAFDIFSHEQDIRRAVGRPGHLDGPAGQACLTRILRAFGAFLPDRVVADEATLVLSVHGAQAATLWLDLGSGEVLDAEPDDPTVTMAFDFADLVPLACGRDDAPDPARVADVRGNDALAARVLTSLAITP